MSRRRVGAMVRRILQQFRRDRRTLALLFVAPVVILSLLGGLLRGAGGHPAVVLVDDDHGPAAVAFAQALTASGAVDVRGGDATSAAADLADGSLAAVVTVPAGMTAWLDIAQHPGLRGAGAPVALLVALEGSEPGPSQNVLAAVRQAEAQVVARFVSPALLPAAPEVTYLHGGASLDTLDYFGPAFIGLAVFFLVFVIAAVSFLRERSQGTLERLMAGPLRRGEVVVGYMLGFGAVALVQSAVVLVFALLVLHVHNGGNVLLVFGVEALMAVAALNLGIFLSMFARTEFQAVQFIPLVIVPQMLLSGVIFPVSGEPRVLQYLSDVLPLTYAVYALRDVMIRAQGITSGPFLVDVAVVLAFAAVMVAAATLTLRRSVA